MEASRQNSIGDSAGGSQGLKYDAEPAARWTPEDFAELLKWGASIGISDLEAHAQSPIWVRLHGDWFQVTERKVAGEELFWILDKISRNDAAQATVKGGEDFNFPYEVQVKRGVKERFRAVATACKDGVGTGVSIVFRSIPEHPPNIEDLEVEERLLRAAYPDNGLVLITGTMGSGKSTLISSMLQWIGQNRQKHIVTYEAPIEFNLMGIKGLQGPIIQSDVPSHLKNFLSGIRNSTRRAPDVIFVGESRDPETLRGMIEAAEIGVAAYSTVHTRSVAESPSRIINVFDQTQQQQIAATMISCLRLIVQQRLLPKVGGGRIAVREFLEFTPALRNQLLRTPVEELIPTIEGMVYQHGQPMMEAVNKAQQAGLITGQQLRDIIKERESAMG